MTGTTRGLGLAVAETLLARGWHVVGLARGPAPERLAAGAYRHCVVDLADLPALERWIERDAPRLFPSGDTGRLGLVNNAALLEQGSTEELKAEALARALLVGSAAPTRLMGWALGAAPRVPLRIVNVSSGAASSPYPGWSAYCMGKAALDMASAVLGLELEEVPRLAGRDASVVSYAPGVVDTAMQAEIRASDPASFPRRARFVELHTRGELVEPSRPAAEIADLLGADGLPRLSRRRFGG